MTVRGLAQANTQRGGRRRGIGAASVIFGSRGSRRGY